MKQDLNNFFSGKFPLQILAFVFLLGVLSVYPAFAGITITPTTWNVVGLDSNRVNDGPNVYPVGARVCNTGGAAVSNIVSRFVWDSTNIYINLDLTETDTQTLSSLAAGACADFYYNVAVTRSTSAYNATRRFHITASGDAISAVSTPTPREIYVEKLVSQNRNSVLSIVGPTTVYVGQTYNYTVNARTATGGYEQLEAFLNLSNVIFRIVSISTTYTAPTGATNDKIYADACGWQNNPTITATYRSCVGPVNFPGGKVGDRTTTTYTVQVLSTGATQATTMIYDFSGSSYHYNSDYGQRVISITALPAPAPDLTIAKSHTGNFTAGSTGTYTLTAANSGTAATVGTVTVTDTLPVGLTVNGGTAGTVTPGGTNAAAWSCNSNAASPQVITCARSAALSNVSGSNTSVFTLTVNIAASVSGTVTNNASISGGGEPAANNGNNTASDPTVTVAVPPNITLLKSCSLPANCTTAPQLSGTDLTYRIQFTNSGGQTANAMTILDANPLNTDFKIGTAQSSIGTSGLIFAIEYSNDYSSLNPALATWTYSPASAGGGAEAGYDRNVKAVRWRVTAGMLSSVAPNNTGNVSFTVKIR